MANAKQLPSGHWRIRPYDKDTKKTVTFTSTKTGKEGKREVELMAAEWMCGKRRILSNEKTLGDCIDEYISLKENILSPTTIDGYRKIKKNSLESLCELPLSKVTQIEIQRHFNIMSINKSPKTVLNAHGLLVATLKIFAPELSVRTTLPKKQKRIKQLPDVADIIRVIKGTDVELPCMLAIWQGMRMSEIRGAKKSDIKNGVLTIQNTVVTVDGKHIEKNQTKTTESTRMMALPKYILGLIDALPEGQDSLTLLTGSVIYKRFTKLLEDNGIDHISFHDLRHLNASIMLMLGIPDKYAMERGGWSTNSTLKSVYQHTFTEEREAVDEKINDYFNDLLNENLS